MEKLPETTATTAKRYATSAVASLIRLSPSTIVTRRRGTPKRRAMAVAAIGSVGDTMAPSTNAELQREIVDRGVGDDCHCERRYHHEPDAEEAYRPQVQLELVQRREERPGVQQRREHGDEHEIGWQLELGHPGNEPQREAADHEDDGVRDAKRRGDHEHGGDGHQQHEEDEQLLVRQLHDDTLRRRVFDAARRRDRHGGRGSRPTRPAQAAEGRTPERKAKRAREEWAGWDRTSDLGIKRRALGTRLVSLNLDSYGFDRCHRLVHRSVSVGRVAPVLPHLKWQLPRDRRASARVWPSPGSRGRVRLVGRGGLQARLQPRESLVASFGGELVL